MVEEYFSRAIYEQANGRCNTSEKTLLQSILVRASSGILRYVAFQVPFQKGPVSGVICVLQINLSAGPNLLLAFCGKGRLDNIKPKGVYVGFWIGFRRCFKQQDSH
jgi:hypothetical protein